MNTSILDMLASRNVVLFDLTPDDVSLCVTEACDHYFHEYLTKVQAEQMIEELKTIVAQMK